MVKLRKFLILAHRYLGIVLSLMFVMWFVTGIGMIYSRGMPRLTPQTRLARLAPLDLSAVHLSPSQAVERGNLRRPEGRVTLLTVDGRPAYRFGGSATVYADSGEYMTGIDSQRATKVAAEFLRVPRETIRQADLLTKPDQWTLTLVPQLPLYRMSVDDPTHTEIYVSPETAEVVQVTTRASRALAWVSTIPHFLYFAPLRMSSQWARTMTWIPAAACVLAFLGIVLGIVQYRKKKPHVPYSGWMRWHYVTGLVFGVLTLTWAFSGLLSMEPWAWTEDDEVDRAVQQTFSSDMANIDVFPAFDHSAWQGILQGRVAKEIEFARVLDEPSFIVRTSPREASLVGWPDGGHQPYFISRDPDSTRFVVPLSSMTERKDAIASDVLMSRLASAHPGVPIVEQTALTEYDTYYYSRDGQAPLPVVRMKFADPASTWVYLDPEVAQVVGQVNRVNRMERWLYNGFHTLDFSFLYYNRPAWDGVIIVLSLGGTVLSTIGLFMGLKRLRRGIQRAAKAA
jgi:hypothetical protein